MPRYRPEEAIQRAVFAHFAVRGARGVFAFHPANGGYRLPVEAAVLKGLGLVPGVPDVIAIYQGQCFALELKAPGGCVSEQQRAVIAAMEAAGATCGIAEGLDAALRTLESWGLLRGRAM